MTSYAIIKFRYLIIALFIILTTGCSGVSHQTVFSKVNKNLMQDYNPFIYKLNSENDEFATYSAEAAGEVSQSIVFNSQVLAKDIFSYFQKLCSFTEDQLVETRLVSVDAPLFVEVWGFNDPKSEREDKRSYLSLVMKQLPNDGGVDFFSKGSCHSKPTIIHHPK
ncbi:hypothetical protein [Vibrio sp. 99-8-1]|uniref:hypothetical protein n=1 Tax=Vibrio sp. 99-8-1 TaxID=2607602 RepID=UPI001493A813|nr:hypothetical protein [Vibrio sp. 99-8-1]NOI65145.1 hypothetical protein [Vibrio sp. 99-8-1]